MLKVVLVLPLIVYWYTIATNTFKYDSNKFKAIGKSSKIVKNYSSFCLEPVIRRKIIELGIWLHHQPYRRSRGTRNLFHRICTIIIEAEQRKQYYDQINSRTTTGNIAIVCQPDNAFSKNDTDSYNCTLENCHSIVNKTADLRARILDNNIDLCALTDTWVKQDDNITVVNMCPAGNSAVSLPWPHHFEGGIAIIYNTNINVSTQKSYNFDSMECCDFSITTWKMRPKDHFILIYRPSNLSMPAFLHDPATVMEGNITESGHLTILGNLDIKINDTYDSDSKLLLDFLDSFALSNKITFPTNRQSNIIDLIISGLHSNHLSNFR